MLGTKKMYIRDSDGMNAELKITFGLHLKYRDEKTDAGRALEESLR